MRSVTPEAVREGRVALARLEDDWSRINRPHVDKGLRDSLYTRILELLAQVAWMQAGLAGGGIPSACQPPPADPVS